MMLGLVRILRRATIASLLILACDSTRGEDLQDAIHKGDLATVRALLEADPALLNSPLGAAGMPKYSPLHRAAMANRPEIARHLLEQGADPNLYVKGHFSTPLLGARSAEMAKLLLKRGARIDVKGFHSRHTPIQEAAEVGYHEIVKVLVGAGAILDIESAVNMGSTEAVAEALKKEPWLAKAPRKLLHAAASRGHFEVAKLLLEYGADPNHDYEFSNVSGRFTPLSSAVTSGHFEIAQLLCERGADTDVSGGKNHDSLFHYAVGFSEMRFTKLMLEHGADIHACDSYGLTPLHVAVARGERDKATLLLDRGADINAKTRDGATPLFFAVTDDLDDMCDFLVSKGAKLDIYTASALGFRDRVEAFLDTAPHLAREHDPRIERTALHWAAREGDLPIVRLLIAKGADINARAERYYGAGNVVTGPTLFRSFDEERDDSVGETPLHVAATAGDGQVVETIIAAGGMVDTCDEDGRTPLFRAVMNGHTQVVQILLKNKAQVNHKDRRGYTPLHHAIDHMSIVRILIDAGSEINDVAESEELIRRLVKQGSNPRFLDTKTTPLRLAAMSRNKAVADLLIKNGAKVDIYSACIFGLAQPLEALLDENPKLLGKVVDNSTAKRPITVAAGRGHLEIVKLLFSKGADKHPKERDDSPFHEAAKNGHACIVEYLLDQGLSIDTRDSTGDTALHSAAAGARPEMVAFLLQRGLDADSTNSRCATPLHKASQAYPWNVDQPDPDDEVLVRGRFATTQVLIDAGASVNATNDRGLTPLHIAAQFGLAEVAALLLDNGADVNARTNRNRTPLQPVGGLYGTRDRTDVIQLLRDRGGEQ